MRFFCLPVKAFQSTIFKYQKLKIIFPPQCLFILLMPISPFMYALHLFHLYILTSPSQKEKKKFHACGWKIETWAHTHIWIFLSLCLSSCPIHKTSLDCYCCCCGFFFPPLKKMEFDPKLFLHVFIFYLCFYLFHRTAIFAITIAWSSLVIQSMSVPF